MNLEKLKEKLIPILEKKNLNIYSIRTKREFGEKIVEILIDTELMDIDELEKIHLEFQQTLTDDDLDPDYFLELSGKYKGYGTLLAFEHDMLSLEINDKGRMKTIEIKFDDARKMRTAIKF